jgi:Arc/MetJ-type ribon-helix-helix transcriptional regulator
MTMSLPADLEALMERLRASNQFESDEEILRVALVDLVRRTDAWASKHADLKSAIAEGLEEPFEPWDMDDIRREVAARLAGRQAAE